MTAAGRRKLLEAWDLLTQVAIMQPVGQGQARVVACDYCGHSASSGHPVQCPVAAALGALLPVIPKFEDREAWVAR